MTSTRRGGPQHIPRPASWQPGRPAPWADLPDERRIVLPDDLRTTFAGRAGQPLAEVRPERPPAAVLAPFYQDDVDGELYVVLTRRSWAMRTHTGEVSFPGGGMDPGETPVDTALREAWEEVDLDPSSVEVLGELDYLQTVASGSYIVPLVGLLPGRPKLKPSPAEVDEILHVPVRELLLPEVYREEVWDFGDLPRLVAGQRMMVTPGPRHISFFELHGDTLWGATASMLRHLLGQALGLGTGMDRLEPGRPA